MADIIVLDLEVYVNADWAIPLTFTDENDTPYNLTGSTFRLDVRDVAGGTLLLSLTTGGGGISSTDLTNGTITLNVPDFALAAGSYVYDLIRISGSVREYLCGGKFTARAGVTA